MDEYVAMVLTAAQDHLADEAVIAAGCFTRVGVMNRSQRLGRRLAPGFPANVLIAVTATRLVCLRFEPGRTYRVTGVVAAWDRASTRVERGHGDGRDGHRVVFVRPDGTRVELESLAAGVGSFDRADDHFFATIGQPSQPAGDAALAGDERRDQRPAVLQFGALAMLGAAALLLGPFLPWAVVRSSDGSVSIGGMHALHGRELGGGGALVMRDAVLALTVLGAGLLLRSRAVLWVGTVAGAVGLAFATYHLATLDTVFVPATGVTLPVGAEIAIGHGLWLCVAGGAVAVVGGLIAGAAARRSAS